MSSSGEATTTATNTTATNTASVGSAQMQQMSSLPSGMPMPKPLCLDNIAANWKKFRRAWDNYAVVVRLQRFDEEYKTATFLSAIGEEALEIYEGMTFEPPESSKVLDSVVQKFEEFCIGQTNETFERYVFNSRPQKEDESIDHYVSTLRTLAKTCNFCQCLHDSLLRDRIVLGVKEPALRKKLLQEGKLTLEKAIDICKSGETTAQHLKDLAAAKDPNADEVHTLKHRSEKKLRRDPKGVKKCKYCGGTHELKREICPAYGKTCGKCGRSNHFAKICMQRGRRKKPAINKVEYSSDSGESLFTVQLTPEVDSVHTIQSNVPSKISAAMIIKEGAEVNFQVDTGATCDVLKFSTITGTKYANRITPTNQVLKMYNASTLRPLGKCKVQLTNSRDNRKYKVNFTVVEDEHCVNLIGSKTAQQMQLITIRSDKIKPACPDPAEWASTTNVDVNLTRSQASEGTTLEHVCSEYKDVFEGLGNLGTLLQLEVDKEVKPVQQPLRRVPEALRTPLKEYLDDLEAKGVIEKVERPTEWVNSVVIARKANGKLRLCLDPKPLNKALKRCHFPMPVIEDILPELGKAKVFTKVDCKDGYWQIKLTEDSSLLTTFATPFGRYKWNRMPFGISPASEIFQLRLHEAVEGLEGTYAIANDILVAGTGDTMKDAIADHDDKIGKLLRRCQERNIKLNKQKVVLKQTEVPYIGHLLTSEGVKADPSKVEAVLNMERPTDVTGVQRIMDTVGYLAKFLLRYPKSQSLSDSSLRREQNLHGTKSMTEHSAGSRRW